MKKLLIGLGLAAMLSGCVSTGLISVFSDDISFGSNYVLRNSSSDKPVICFNKETEVRLEFNFVGKRSDFSSFQVVLTGQETKQEFPSKVLNVSPTPALGVTVDNQRVKVTFTFPANQVPYSQPVRTQAVIVTPVNPPNQTPATYKGALNLNLKITDSSGSSASSNFLVNDIPVYDNCPAAL